MDDITVLTSLSSTSDELTVAANNIIINYDLHFNTEEILKVFKNLRTHPYLHFKSNLVYLALTTNLRIFIAIVYASFDKIIDNQWYHYLIQRNSTNYAYELGCTTPLVSHKYIAKIYCELYDYYEFDITEIKLLDNARTLIQQHIDSKRNYTKPAVKK